MTDFLRKQKPTSDVVRVTARKKLPVKLNDGEN